MVKKLEDMNEAELKEQGMFCLNQRKAIRKIVHCEEETQKESLFIAYGKRLDEIVKEIEKREENKKGVDIMSNVQNGVETVTASVNAEVFHEEEGKGKRILQPFVAICPVCGWKNIIDAKCARKKKMGNCSHCHSKTWLNLVGKLKRFGRNGQYFKIVWFHGAV